MTPSGTDQACFNDSAPAIEMQQLVDRCMGSLEFAERCLTRFEQRLRADVEEIQRAVEAEDGPQLAQLAHRLKGSAATVAAPGVARTAAALEAHGRGKCAEESGQLMAEFLHEVERFFNCVPRFSPIGRSPD